MTLQQVVSKVFHLFIPSDKQHVFKKGFSLVFSLIFIAALYGASSLKILSIISLYYFTAKKWRGTPAIVYSWGFSLGVLYLNNRYSGYQFSALSPYLYFLDSWRGVGLRWHITFNFNVLRMISFTMDRNWALKKGNVIRDEYGNPTSKLDKRQRLEISHVPKDYNFVNYLCYILYAPLFLAGPIISFNDFLHQCRAPPASITWKSTFKYLARWLGTVLIMETMMHFMYVVAIKNNHGWRHFGPFQTYTLGYFNLKMIWLKVILIDLASHHLEILSYVGYVRWN
jgi:D-alanyl-lipoteichoic acid acyltransferase DltB (MBOAT superfamily)